MDIRRGSASFNIEVTDGGVLDGTEEAAPLLGNIRIIISNGVVSAIEDAAEPVALRSKHHVGIVGTEVDVGCQLHIKTRLALCQVFGKPGKILCTGDETESLAICCQLIVSIPCSADSAEATVEGVRRNR